VRNNVAIRADLSLGLPIQWRDWALAFTLDWAGPERRENKAQRLPIFINDALLWLQKLIAHRGRIGKPWNSTVMEVVAFDSEQRTTIALDRGGGRAWSHSREGQLWRLESV